jgi:uncharacterized protein (TIGR02147 family)
MTSKRKIQNQLVPADLRKHLQHELMRRCEDNARYSLRAFAKSLDIHHSTLSTILSGKRPLTGRATLELSKKLGLSPIDAKRYVDQAKKRKISLPLASQTIAEYSALSLDVFSAISEWYHDAILELTHLTHFQGDAKWIAKTLGLSVSEVNIASERLQNLKLLRIHPNGRWEDISRFNTNLPSNEFTSLAHRKYQKKILELSQNSIENIPREKRDHTSTTIAIDPADLPQVKEIIREFRLKLAAYLEQPDREPKAVYQLAVSFFPLTQDTERSS